MRLRICDQAAEETQKAARAWPSNDMQAELARKQAATIRTMRREGIERGGFEQSLPRCLPARRKSQAARNRCPFWPVPSRRGCPQLCNWRC